MLQKNDLGHDFIRKELKNVKSSLTINPQPSTINHQPSTLNPSPINSACFCEIKKVDYFCICVSLNCIIVV